LYKRLVRGHVEEVLMKRSKTVFALVAGTLLLGLVAEAGAVDFSPTITFALDDTKSLANPILRVDVKQDMGEEELESVSLTVPPGFTLAQDAQLQEGEKLGEGTITIHAGPRCRGAPVGSAPATVPVNIIERTRRASEIQDGAIAVYVVDIQGVTRIELVVKGKPDNGYTLTGVVPPNADTCPPFEFSARFFRKAERSGTQIFTNPQYGGSYTFEANFKGLGGSTSHSEQVLTIDGPAKPGGGGGDGSTISEGDAKKKCKRIKNRVKRKKCLRRLKG
jgi:hypothetical protein